MTKQATRGVQVNTDLSAMLDTLTVSDLQRALGEKQKLLERLAKRRDYHQRMLHQIDDQIRHTTGGRTAVPVAPNGSVQRKYNYGEIGDRILKLVHEAGEGGVQPATIRRTLEISPDAMYRALRQMVKDRKLHKRGQARAVKYTA